MWTVKFNKCQKNAERRTSCDSIGCMYRETVWHSDSKERLGKVCVLLHEKRHWPSCCTSQFRVGSTDRDAICLTAWQLEAGDTLLPSSCLSACDSTTAERVFMKFIIWLLLKFIENLQMYLKSANSLSHFARRPACVCMNIWRENGWTFVGVRDASSRRCSGEKWNNLHTCYVIGDNEARDRVCATECCDVYTFGDNET
jgi:hypothetical protein